MVFWFQYPVVFPSLRTSGVTDHYAQDDPHALHLARRVVSNLNIRKQPQVRKVSSLRPNHIAELDEVVIKRNRNYLPIEENKIK